MVADCTTQVEQVSNCKKRKVELSFDGGDITSDGGALLLREAEKDLGLLSKVSSLIPEWRSKGMVYHSIEKMLRQRVFGICLGYEDLNDLSTLRNDPSIQTAADSVQELASPSTLCRLENNIDETCLMPISEMLVDVFLGSYLKPPKSIILDIDSTDDEVHGNQEGRYFSAFYDHYCFQPLYVYCGDHLLASYLRPGWVSSGHNCSAVIKLLVKKIRSKWPDVQIVVRGDSGFQKPRLLSWCDDNDVDYVIGVAKNSVLLSMSGHLIKKAAEKFENTGKKQNTFPVFTMQLEAGIGRGEL